MKASVDRGLTGAARTALASRDVTGVAVHSDWASLTLKGHAASRTPALAAVHTMTHAGAVNTVTYICTDGASCSGAPAHREPPHRVPASAAPSASPSTAPSSSPSAPGDLEARIRRALGKDGVTFATGSISLTPQAEVVLDHVASMLAQSPGLRVRVAGYTDNSGSASVNRALSLARANATRDYLAARGVSASRMKTAGFGSEHPIAANSTAAGRAANRRIEFTVQGS